MKIIVWTQNPIKLKAIQTAIKKCNYLKNKEIEIIWEEIDSEVSDMPLSLTETMDWAKNRANNLKNKKINADFYIWMEWWTNQILNETFLFWVIYILNKNWKWYFWISNMMKVPKYFVKRIYENKEELWKVLTEVTWIIWASKKKWAFWAWSDNMLTREDQFVFAFLSAIVPFFNKYYKI